MTDNTPRTSALAPFSFTYKNLPLRVEQDADGEPLFHAGDLCAILEYANPRDAVSRHVHAEDVVKRDTLTAGGRQQTNFIREPGLWALIMGSETEAAKPVKRWVTAEVLPAIRKTGSYAMPGAQPTASPLAPGMRWLAHVEPDGKLIFSPVDPTAFHLPARDWPKVIRTPDFPRHLLPEVLSAVSERMKGLPSGAPSIKPVAPLADFTLIDPAQVAAFVADKRQVSGREICAGLGIADSRSHLTQIGNAMRKLGWRKRQVNGGQRVYFR